MMCYWNYTPIYPHHRTRILQFSHYVWCFQNELAKKFFNDGRSFDLEGLKECMVRAYEYIDGVEDILCCLKKNNYEMHAFANYPVWWVLSYFGTFVHGTWSWDVFCRYKLIEDKLKLSKYLSWTFCSCRTGNALH